MSNDSEQRTHDHGGEPCAIAELTRPEPVRRQAEPGPSLSLDRDDAILFVIDVQERLAAAMQPEALERLVRNTTLLIRAATRLGLPIVCSEQYPRGLGATLTKIKELLTQPPLEKLEFSAGNNEAIARAVLATRRRQAILAGMESHVCVFQTARDLAKAGFATFVVDDAVLSRTESNRELGLRLSERAGAVRTGTETVVFDLLGQAGTPEFKEISPLLR